MTLGSIVKHPKFGEGKIKIIKEDEIVVDFDKFEITFKSSEAQEQLVVTHG